MYFYLELELSVVFVFYNLELSLIGPGSSIHISIFFFDGADTQKAQQ